MTDRELFDALKRMLSVKVTVERRGQTWPKNYVVVTLALKDPVTGKDVEISIAEDWIWDA